METNKNKPPSVTSGVTPFCIGGRMVNLRERLLGMTPEERRWRAQYLKDQILEPDEPRFSPEYYKDTHNIFRRLGRYPLDILTKPLAPLLGEKYLGFRNGLGRILMFVTFAYYIAYNIKYGKQDWTAESGWRIVHERPVYLPGDPEYGQDHTKKPHEYYDMGFSEYLNKL